MKYLRKIVILICVCFLFIGYINVMAKENYNKYKIDDSNNQMFILPDELKESDILDIEIINMDEYGVMLAIRKEDNKNYNVFIDYKGNIYKNPILFKDDIAVIEIENKFGYINKNYEWIVPPIYDYMESFNNGYGIAQRNNMYYIIDVNGQIKYSSQNTIYQFDNGYALMSWVDNDGTRNYASIDLDLNINYISEMSGYYIFIRKSNSDRRVINRNNNAILGYNPTTNTYTLFDISGEIICTKTIDQKYTYYTSGVCLYNRSAIICAKDSNLNCINYLLTEDGKVVENTNGTDIPFNINGAFSFGNKYIITYYNDIYDMNLKLLGELYFDENFDDIITYGYKDIFTFLPISLSENTNSWMYNMSADKLYFVIDEKIQKKVDLVDLQKIKEPLKNNQITVYINNKQLNFDIYPITEKDRTLVPMRAIFEALGAEVEWENETQTATATKEGITVSVTIDSNRMLKNGEEIELDVPARLVGDSRTLVPLRAISEAFGCQVEWDEELQRVDIYSN